jgi:hypothetical protein
METNNLIQNIVSGDASEVKDILTNMISTIAFGALEGKKQEIAQSLFGAKVADAVVEEEAEQIDELSYDTLHSYKRKARKEIHKMNPTGNGPSPKNEKKFEKRVAGFRKAWQKQDVAEEVVNEESLTAGKRLISKHGEGRFTAKVYRDPEYNEYQSHFYENGKHMGEGPVGYHDDKEEAQSAAEHGIKHMETNSK